MTVWYSSAGRQASEQDGTAITRTGDIYVDITTDANGMFSIDITNLNVTIDRVLEATGFVVSQVLTSATDVVNLMRVLVVEITDTIVKGVVVLGNSVTASIDTVVKPLKRAGSGVDARIKLTVVRKP